MSDSSPGHPISPHAVASLHARKEPAAAFLCCRWQPSRQERSRRARSLLVVEAVAELPDPGEAVAERWPEQGASGDQLSPTQPTERRPSTELRVVRETNTSPLHITSLPSSHRVTLRTQRHSFLTSAISNKPGWLVSFVVRHVRLGIAPTLSGARSQQRGFKAPGRNVA